MKQAAHNTFTQGMVTDLTPLTTPNNVLTDCLNGTIITYAGNEFTLQNDMGNCKVDTAFLKPGFLPVGMTEYGGFVYIASHNPETGVDEVGSFPSPQRDFSTTDHNNIGPVEFTTSMFTVNTGSPVKENLNVTRKLFEPEIFKLNPGDMYLVEYTINTPASGDPSAPDTINNETKLENYITKDIANRKLFRLKFYKITSANNLVELDEGKINVVPHASDADLDNEYAYFTESSSSVLATSLEIETLDLFQANVIDASTKTNSDKKVGIEAIGKSASLADFQGIRVDVTQPSTLTTYLDKGSNVTNKVSAIIDGLAANDNFECTVTPYSKYCLFPKLQQNFKFTLGKYLTTGSGANNLFRYYVDPTYVRIDFDYTFQGNSANGPYLYIEFYDPWSDYSIVKPVDNPTFYGINTVIIGTVNEPLVDQFDSTTVGGTPANKLITNTDTTYQKTLLNSTGLIRTDQFLRLDTFYIVRISGVDSDTSTGSLVYNHYDFYKGIYTTSMFNDVYVAQNGLTTSDPAYVSDFNALDFDISSIGYQSVVTQTNNFNSTPTIVNTPTQLMTGGNFYMINETKNTSFNHYLSTQTFSTETDYSIQLTLENTNNVFGTFRDNLVSITIPTLVDSNTGGNAPIVTNQGYDNDNDINPDSIANWSITATSGGFYNVTTTLNTSRKIYMGVNYNDTQPFRDYREISLINSFAYRPNGDSTYTHPKANFQFVRNGSNGSDNFGKGINKLNRILYYNPDTAVQETVYTYQPPLGNGTNDQNPPSSFYLYTLFDQYTKKYSGMWGGFFDDTVNANPDRWYEDKAPGTYGGLLNKDRAWREGILFLRNDKYQTQNVGTYIACRTTDVQAAIDFFTHAKIASNVSRHTWLHYADPSVSSKFNKNIVTTAKFSNAPITTNFTPHLSGMSYIKTYLSDFRFKANNDIEEFNPTVINSYIASRQSDSVILDGKNTIRDGFIPFITTQSTSVFDLSFNDIVITQAADSTILTSMNTSFNIGSHDPVFQSAGTNKLHGTLFTDRPELYDSFIKKFVPKGVPPDDTIITGDEIYMVVNDASEPFYQGWYGYGGSARPNNNEAPDMYLDFANIPRAS